VHLRWATDGLAVRPENTHPFVEGDRALAHNGSINPIDDLDALLALSGRLGLRGDTDSERYFRFVQTCIDQAGGDERAGLLRAVGTLRASFPTASLNALLLTSTHLFAVHTNSEAATPLEDLRELFETDDAMPRGHMHQYFDMAYRETGSSVHVVSSGLSRSCPFPPPNWHRDQMSVRGVIQSRLADLSPQERRVARVLLADYPRAGLRTSGDLAATAGVSAPTVVRFARSLGHAGFAGFQQALIDELSERVASPLSQYDSTRSDRVAAHWLERGVEIATDSIAASLRAIPTDELDATVDLLADPKLRVTALGGRYSRHIAGYLAAHLQQMRPGVRRADLAQSVSVADMIDADRGDLFVVYDFRRYERSTVDGCTALAKAGAHIVCITDEWLSPVAQVAEVVLPTSVRSSGAFDSSAAAFLLTELLVDALLDRLGNTALTRMRRWEETSAHQVQD
jgi:DNA-binding MurR/RpiR family transcriptional regulator